MSACQKERSVWERSVISTRCCYTTEQRDTFPLFQHPLRVHRHESTRLTTMLSGRTRHMLMFDDVSSVLRGNGGCCTSMSTCSTRALLQSSVGHLQTFTPDAWSRCVCNRRCINKVGQKWAEWMIVSTEGQNGAWRSAVAPELLELKSWTCWDSPADGVLCLSAPQALLNLHVFQQLTFGGFLLMLALICWMLLSHKYTLLKYS